MIEVADFRKEFMQALMNEPHNVYLKPLIGAPQLEVLENAKLSYAILDADTKRVLFCGGVSEYWTGRGECWAIFSANVRKDFVLIHRAVKRYFEMVRVKRIEAAVKTDFKEGHRWIKSLGFCLEAACLKAYLPDGSDAALYSRVK